MKVVQTCDTIPKPVLTAKTAVVGTVFKMKCSTQTWLKVAGGFINLTENIFYATLNADYAIDLTYPNAKIVLE